MSKKIKIFIAVLAGLVLVGGSFVLLKPKKDSGLVEKEISIKQAEVPAIDTLTYKDSAGFSFEYPSLLKITEVEVDDDSIFSALELEDFKGDKMMVRVADSVYDNTDDWQEDFENKNVISDLDRVMFSDIPAVKFMFGAPILLKTVGVENKIIYSIENAADNGGFFDQAHTQVLESFRFDDSVYKDGVEVEEESSNESIVLIEELLE